MSKMHSQTGILVGFTAAACAFGAAALMSAATASTARADAYTDIINAVDGDYAAGQADFTAANADFASNDVSGGLVSFVEGVDDDSLSPSFNVLFGTVEALTNEPQYGSYLFSLLPVTDFSDGLSLAKEDFASGEGAFSTAAADLAAGDYGQAVSYELVGSYFTSIIPLEDVLLGAAASF
jgi:hypothetical protein